MTMDYTPDSEVPTPLVMDRGNRKGSKDFEAWAGVQQRLIESPLEDLTSEIRRSIVPDHVRQLTSQLQELMWSQIEAPAGRVGLNIRMAYGEYALLEEFVDTVVKEGKPDDERIVMEEEMTRKYTKAGVTIPRTKKEAKDRQAKLDEYIDELEEAKASAKKKGCWWDVCDLIDWSNSAKEDRGSPEKHLPYAGKELWSVLGLSSEGTEHAHRQAVSSNQIAQKWGGAAKGQEKRSFMRLFARNNDNNNQPPQGDDFSL